MVWVNAYGVPAWLQGLELSEVIENEKGDRNTEELGADGLGSLMEEPQHPGSSTCLLYRVEQGSLGFCRQLNREERVYYTAGSRRQIFLISIGEVFVGERSSDHKKQWELVTAHTLSICMWTTVIG